MTAAALAGELRLATRGSALALAQARLAGEALSNCGVGRTRLVVVSTRGDRDQTVPITELSGQGWFTAEVERELLDGRADVAVHSAKDLPTALTPGLALAALLPRADPRDALVTRDGRRLDELPAGAAVGSSSARRRALLAARRADLRVTAMRGNVDTRLRKLDAGEVDALVLAAAGLDRLGLSARIAERFEPRSFVPAPAQGAIALEAVAASAALAAAAAAGDEATALAVRAERAVLAGLGGGCLLPLGVWARLEHGGELVVSAALEVGAELRRVELAGDPERPLELADRVVAALR